MKYVTKIRRIFRQKLLSHKLGIFFYLTVTCLLFTAVQYNASVCDKKNEKDIQHYRFFQSTEHSLAVLVLSDRESFVHRERIRKTWGIGQRNLYFVVGENYCPYPPENRISHTCVLNNNSLTTKHLRSYLNKEDEITKKLVNEPDVILVPTRDDPSELSNKVIESYRWSLRTLTAEWILHVEDTVYVEMQDLENFLNTLIDGSKKTFLLSSVQLEETKQYANKTTTTEPVLGRFICGFNHVVSRAVAGHMINFSNTLFKYVHENNYDGIKVLKSINITSGKSMTSNFMSKGPCNMSSIVKFDLCLPNYKSDKCLHSNSTVTGTMKNNRNSTNFRFENPSIYLNSDRFDVVVKIVYAYFHVFKTQVPRVVNDSYVHHLKVWNNFNEYCQNVDKKWYDAKRPCTDKRGLQDYISAFHSTIDLIRKNGFNSSLSRIPVDRHGFLLNGAHRLASSVVLSKDVIFEHQTYEQHFGWGYRFFKNLGLSSYESDTVMLEYMKQQTVLPSLKTHVSIVSVFSNDHAKDTHMLKLVKANCSKDNGVLYEKTVSITKYGARQLITHMYGKQSWVETKIQQMLSKFGSEPTVEVLFLFIYGKENKELVACKTDIRKLYNDKIFKSTVHIPDSPEENLILAKMILNQNSVQFMNYANDPTDCQRIAKEIARRSSAKPIKTLPDMYLGRDDIMIDSGAVLGLFGLRNRTDVDILFLQDIDKSILGNKNGLNVQAHAFKFNSISKERPWGEDHFNETGPKDQWDLFYDPKYYGYCYGMKFVSLDQMIRYKIKRNEPNKDQRDVHIVKDFLNTLNV